MPYDVTLYYVNDLASHETFGPFYSRSLAYDYGAFSRLSF
jgi:hypothetical protein